MAIADGHGLPIAVRVTSSSPNESTLVEDTLSQRHVGGLPKRLIADCAYDSDRVDERLRQEHSVAGNTMPPTFSEWFNSDAR